MGIDDNHGGGSSSSNSWGVLLPPSVAPMLSSGGGGGGGGEREEHWRSFDNSVNAVSFGFVATAILISMFLVMAIFERFLRPRSSSSTAGGSGSGRNSSDLEGQTTVHGKLNNYPSPKMTVYARGVSVLMPGEEIPTFIAHPAPAPALVPCPPECISRPLHLSLASPMHNNNSNNTSPSALH